MVGRDSKREIKRFIIKQIFFTFILLKLHFNLVFLYIFYHVSSLEFLLLLFVMLLKKTKAAFVQPSQPFPWCTFLLGLRSYSGASFIFVVICYIFF